MGVVIIRFGIEGRGLKDEKHVSWAYSVGR